VNVLMTITAYPPSVGGAQIHTHRLAVELARRNAVRVLSHWDSNRTDWLRGTTINAPGEDLDYVLEGIAVRRMGFTWQERMVKLPFAAAYYPLMDACLPVLAHQLIPRLENFGAGVNVVHNVRVGREPLSYASCEYARKHDLPFILTPLHHPRWEGWLHRHYQRLYRTADAVITLTNAEKQVLCGLGVDDSRVHVTGIGPVLAEQGDGEAFRACHGLGDHPLILFLGQKYEYKGVKRLLNAAGQVWKTHPEVCFGFLGPDTPFSASLFTEIKDPRLLVMGSVDLQTKTDALAACDIFCLPSSQESFGGVYVEAWMMGKPVVGCSIPAVTEVIRDGVDGLLVAPQSSVDEHELAERLVWLLEHPGERAQMGAAGKLRAQHYFSWDGFAQKVEAAYIQAGAGRTVE